MGIFDRKNMTCRYCRQKLRKGQRHQCAGMRRRNLGEVEVDDSLEFFMLLELVTDDWYEDDDTSHIGDSGQVPTQISPDEAFVDSSDDDTRRSAPAPAPEPAYDSGPSDSGSSDSGGGDSGGSDD